MKALTQYFSTLKKRRFLTFPFSLISTVGVFGKKMIEIMGAFFLWLAGITKETSAYTGAFMDKREKASFLQKKHTGFVLGTQRQSLSLENCYRNLCVYGSIGSGKTSTIILPTLAHLEHSCICLDIGNTLYEKTAGHLKQKGFTIKRIRLGEVALSERYNPLQRAKTASSMKQLSQILINAGMGKSGSGDAFWINSSRQLLYILLRAIKEHTNPEFHTLHNLRHLINNLSASKKSPTFSWIAKTVSDELFTEFKGLMASSADRTIDNILLSLRAALEKASDPDIALLTAKDTLGDFHALFREQKTILYIGVKESSLHYHAFFLSLLLTDVFSALQEAKERTANPVLLLLDEIGHIPCPSLATSIATLRKRNVALLLCLQSRSQLYHLYGAQQAEVILGGGCASHLYLAGQHDFRLNEELSRLLGLQEVENQSGGKVARPLLSIDQLHSEKGQALLVQAGKRPLRLSLKPYFQQRSILKMLDKPAPQLTFTEAATPPLTPLGLLSPVVSST